MIRVLHHPSDTYCVEIVRAALARSFTAGQVETAPYGAAERLPSGVVLIHPETASELPADLWTHNRKILVLGRTGTDLAGELGLRVLPHERFDPRLATGVVVATKPYNASPGFIQYVCDHPLGMASGLRQRHLCRYDFSDEWNNLGYGRIGVDGGPWSLAQMARCDGATPIAHLVSDDPPYRAAYATLTDTAHAAVLWYNRAVGPVDSLEWPVIETFFGNYRAGDLPCIPYLSEIPHGYDGAVAARLDCDEAIASARALFELYEAHGVPLSLAICTQLPMAAADQALVRDVCMAGGAAVSHSWSHAPNWGGSYAAAVAEATLSRRLLQRQLPARAAVRNAVSPFHQNPDYAIKALADAGYSAFVGGIIRNDPEYLLGRAGRVPFGPALVSHSQQCMMHGDCYSRAGGTIAVYTESFNNHLQAKAAFGYLDHPFSARYQYGWHSEGERISAHAALLQTMKSIPGLWWPNLDELLAFLCQRDATTLRVLDRGALVVNGPEASGKLSLSIRWQGRNIALSPSGTTVREEAA